MINKNSIIEYSLMDKNNYHNIITYTIKNMINKYINLIIEYILLITEKINIHDKCMYHYIFSRGIDVVSHVYLLLLVYTSNIELSYYHGQKAFYFYVEFIQQISNEENISLNLNSTNAMLFVYKKTIFDINKAYKVNINENILNCKILSNFIKDSKDKINKYYHKNINENNHTNLIEEIKLELEKW
jgi:hypothetical protein